MDSVKAEKWVQGAGDSSGCGSGYGSGCGSGSGYGDGYGWGWVCGSGYGDGDGSGYGDGDDDGAGVLIKKYGGYKVFYIDNIPTIILNCKGNLAKGYIVNRDFSVCVCYIAKSQGLFAHGKTAREAATALRDKIFQKMSTEDRIAEFRKRFDKNEKYIAASFFEWHKKLTGSCLMGRQQFIRDYNINLDNEYTVAEFIALTENSYGGDVIQKLKKYYVGG